MSTARKFAVGWLAGLFLMARSDAHAQNAQGWAALVVDVQACFVTGGSLAVPGADLAYLLQVSRAAASFKKRGYTLFASRDYHPPGHVSFASSHPGAAPFTTIRLPDGRLQKLWPDHCLYTTGDSRLQLDSNLFFETVKKGQNVAYDSNSAFTDDSGANTELHAILKAKHIKNLVVFGLATDVCVKASVMDALKLGYNVYVYVDLSRGVSPTETNRAIREMGLAGAKIVRGTL